MSLSDDAFGDLCVGAFSLGQRREGGRVAVLDLRTLLLVREADQPRFEVS
jgi:hypothetical protein